MTDNEIIKAVDMCRSCTSNANCGKCPYSEHEEDCIASLCADVFDLINRQKAEIEALIAGQETLQKYMATQKAEIERLERRISELQHEILSCKTEAVKEFAAKVLALFPSDKQFATVSRASIRQAEAETANGE